MRADKRGPFNLFNPSVLKSAFSSNLFHLLLASYCFNCYKKWQIMKTVWFGSDPGLPTEEVYIVPCAVNYPVSSHIKGWSWDVITRQRSILQGKKTFKSCYSKLSKTLKHYIMPVQRLDFFKTILCFICSKYPVHTAVLTSFTSDLVPFCASPGIKVR